MCYVVQRPSAAVVASGLYLLVVAAGLFVLGHYGWLGSFTAFLLMGCGSILAVGLLFWRLGVLKSGPGADPDVSGRGAVRGNWSDGGWLVEGAVVSALWSQTRVVAR